MDGHRFDDFARVFHVAGSRRRALTALLAGTGSSLLAGLAAEAGKGKKKKKKKTICHCPTENPAECVTLKLKKKAAKKHLKKHANDFAGACPGVCIPGGDCDIDADCCLEGEQCVNGICSLTICEAATCDTFVQCSDEFDCFCGTRPISEGSAGFCGDNGSCADEIPCESSSDCPSGYACIVDTCCGSGFCIGACGTCGIGASCNPDAAAPRRGGDKRRTNSGR